MADTQGNPGTEGQDRLRHTARELLRQGVAPRNSGGTLGVDALQLLYQRASNPDTAADALRLLHELQTYQVELDLLHEQLEANEQELTEELAHYRALFELAPAAYLNVASDGAIIEANRAAEKLFGESAGSLHGKTLSRLMAPGQEDLVDTLVSDTGKQAADRPGIRPVTVHLADRRRVTIRSGHDATQGSTLVMLTDTAPDSADP